MIKQNAAIAVLLLSSAVLRAENPPAVNLTIEKIGVGTAVENRELSGASATFDTATPKVYCWIKAVTAQAPTTATFVWFADEKEVARVQQDIKYPAARTWSSKNVWPGQWRVEIADSAGAIVSSTAFAVGGSTPTATSQ